MYKLFRDITFLCIVNCETLSSKQQLNCTACTTTIRKISWTSTSSHAELDVYSQDQTNTSPLDVMKFVKRSHDCGGDGQRKKDFMGELDPVSTYLLPGKPWPQSQSRPMISPTNYQDVLQAGFIFFFLEQYMPCFLHVHGRASCSTAGQKKVALLFGKPHMWWWFKGLFFETSGAVCYNKHTACLNKTFTPANTRDP